MMGICKLCAKENELQDSHFIPKSVYKKMNNSIKQDYSIMLLTNKNELLPLAKHIKAYHLCKNCEDLFNKHGEKFFVDNAFPKGKYDESDLLDMNKNMPELVKCFTQILGNCNGEVYYRRIFPEHYREKLFYFAVSMFWRGTLNWANCASINISEDIKREMKSYLLNRKPPSKFKICMDLATHELPMVGAPIQISENKYIFNIMYFIFTLEIINSAISIPIKFGRNKELSDFLYQIFKIKYNSAEVKGKKPADISW